MDFLLPLFLVCFFWEGRVEATLFLGFKERKKRRETARLEEALWKAQKVSSF